ncbi:MAG: ribonuclease D [Gemmatimonadales bacterium]
MADPLIARDGELGRLVRKLSLEHRLALDTESASFHRYVDRVYLIQVGYGDRVALIDPLAVRDLSPLGGLLADRAIEVVLHDADYDLRVLDRDYGFRIRNLFDTRVAAELAGEPGVGLAALLERHFGMRLNKRLQRADWSRRPLTERMLAYAADDVRHLLSLRDILEHRLAAMGRLDWALEEFARLESVGWSGPDDAERYLRIRGARGLPPRSLAVLRALHQWREATARKLDRAPFRVIANAALLGVAQACPRSVEELSRVDGFPDSLVRKYGRAVLAAVEAGLAIPEDRLPRVPRASRAEPDPLYDQRLERLKLLRNRRASELGLAPGLVCPNGTLQALARLAPSTRSSLEQVPELRNWQLEVLGEEALLSAIRDGP